MNKAVLSVGFLVVALGMSACGKLETRKKPTLAKQAVGQFAEQAGYWFAVNNLEQKEVSDSLDQAVWEIDDKGLVKLFIASPMSDVEEGAAISQLADLKTSVQVKPLQKDQMEDQKKNAYALHVESRPNDYAVVYKRAVEPKEKPKAEEKKEEKKVEQEKPYMVLLRKDSAFAMAHKKKVQEAEARLRQMVASAGHWQLETITQTIGKNKPTVVNAALVYKVQLLPTKEGAKPVETAVSALAFGDKGVLTLPNLVLKDGKTAPAYSEWRIFSRDNSRIGLGVEASAKQGVDVKSRQLFTLEERATQDRGGKNVEVLTLLHAVGEGDKRKATRWNLTEVVKAAPKAVQPKKKEKPTSKKAI